MQYHDQSQLTPVSSVAQCLIVSIVSISTTIRSSNHKWTDCSKLFLLNCAFWILMSLCTCVSLLSTAVPFLKLVSQKVWHWCNVHIVQDSKFTNKISASINASDRGSHCRRLSLVFVGFIMVMSTGRHRSVDFAGWWFIWRWVALVPWCDSKLVPSGLPRWRQRLVRWTAPCPLRPVWRAKTALTHGWTPQRVWRPLISPGRGWKWTTSKVNTLFKRRVSSVQI